MDINDFIPDIPCIPTLICGNFCTLSISEEREVYSWGTNGRTKIGHDVDNSSFIVNQLSKYKKSHREIINKPTKIPKLRDIKMIASGYNHTLLCDFTGNIYIFGSYVVMDDKELPPIDKVYSTNDVMVFLTYEGELYSCGSGPNGELGRNTTNATKPEQITDLCNIEFVSCGSHHVFCKTYNNEIFSWGKNDKGQLGNGTKVNEKTPKLFTSIPDEIISIKCGNSFSLFLTVNGIVYGCGDNEYNQTGQFGSDKGNITTPKKIEKLPLIKRIECGLYHSICIDKDNQLWGFGYNYCGQLGFKDYKPKEAILNKDLPEIKDISSGDFHTYIKTIDNKIYAFGRNDKSQLGFNSEKYLFTPTQIFCDKEDIWCESNRKSRAKSARK